ncbi:MAG: hypothetical protein AB1806_10775 [Acidobacteriota bacterium]
MTPPTAALSSSTAQGSIWPSAIFNGLFGGPADGLTHVIDRYGVSVGFGHDRRSALYADVGDISVTYYNGQRDLFTLERRVWSRYNQRATARLDTDRLRLSGGYGYFRQASSGLEYLYAPSLIAGGTDPQYVGGSVGYLGRFIDNVKDSLFATTRATYNVAIELKPAMFGDKASAKATFSGIDRSGRTFETLNTGGGDVVGTDADRRAKLRWHGYESIVDESSNELTFTVSARPTKRVNVEYELGYERFRNHAPVYTFTDLSAAAGIGFASTAAAAGAGGAFAAAVANWPLHFLPDSNMLRQAVRASAGNDRVLVGAGAGWNALTQETFTDLQRAAGYQRGDIESNQVYVSMAARPSSVVRLEAYARRSETNRRMDRYDAKLRLNGFTLSTYGVEAELRRGRGRFVVTPGWTRRVINRDVAFGDVPAQRSLIRTEGSSNEVFLRTRWTFSSRVSLRATPSVVWADKTGYVTEPERAGRLNLALALVSDDGSRSATAFYTIRTRRNNRFSFVGSDGASVTQDAKGSLQQLGVAGSLVPRDFTNVYWSYAWSRDEYTADLFSATTRRYDATPVFYSRGIRPRYLLGSHTITAGMEVAPAGGMTYSVSYTATRTGGDTASGLVLSLLPAEDGHIENWYHAAAVRIERDLGSALRLGINYMLDYYDDGSYTSLTGGRHSLMLGVGYRF